MRYLSLGMFEHYSTRCKLLPAASGNLSVACFPPQSLVRRFVSSMTPTCSPTRHRALDIACSARPAARVARCTAGDAIKGRIASLKGCSRGKANFALFDSRGIALPNDAKEQPKIVTTCQQRPSLRKRWHFR